MSRERVNYGGQFAKVDDETVERYAQEIRELDLSVPRAHIDAMADTLGVRAEVESMGLEEIINVDGSSAQKWIDSPGRRFLNRAVAMALAYPVGGIMIEGMKQKVRSSYPELGSGTITLEFGVWGPEVGKLVEPIVKIRTMRRGAGKEIASPFRWPTFLAGSEFAKDKDSRILDSNFIRGLRRTGLDEMPQVWQVARGNNIDLVGGVRGFMDKELDGIEFLWALRNDERLDLSDETRMVLEAHANMVDDTKQRPSVMGAGSAYQAKDTPHMIIQLGSVMVSKFATPKMDFTIMLNSIYKRGKGVGAR